MSPGRPDWWQPLLARVAQVRAEDFTRIPAPAEGGRPSAVLILLGSAGPAGSVDAAGPAGSVDAAGPAGSVDAAGACPDVLLVQRAAKLRNHAGQPAFPGGAADPDDVDAAGTALREAAEEVGLDPASVEVLAELPALWIPVSQFLVTPVLAWWRTPHPVAPVQPAEVARVERVPVAELVEPANRLWVRHPSGWIGPAFRVRSMLVWGFTAGVLSVLLDLAGWSRPWPDAPQGELPIVGDRPVP